MPLDRARIRETLLPALLLCTLAAKFLILTSRLDVHDYPLRRAATSATSAVCLALLGVPLVWVRPRARLPFVLVASALLTTLALADVLHFRFYRDVISMAELSQLRELAAVTSSVRAMMRPADALLFLDLLAGAALAAATRNASHSPPSSRAPARRRLEASVALLLVAALLATPALRLIRLDAEEVFAYSTTRREVAVALGLLPFHLFDAVEHLLHPVRGRFAVGPEERERARRWFERRREAPLPGSPLFGRARGRNVILVMAESLERFPVGLAIDGQPVAPVLSRFAAESVDFTGFLDQTHLGTTADAEFVSLQSLHPLPDAVVATRYFTNDLFGLPAILAEHGYRSLSANAMNGDFWNMRQMHARLGFGASFFKESFDEGETIGMGLADAETLPQIAARLSVEPEPFLAYVITLSNHSPYDLPPRHRSLRLGKLEGTLVGDYLHSVHYFDAAFGSFLDALRRDGLLDRSVVVLYGDHRAFWTDVPELPALLGHPPDDRFRTWSALATLPLLVRLPGGEEAGPRPAPGGHLDVAPTLLGLLGIPPEREILMGRDLLAGGPPLVAFRDGVVVAGRGVALGAGGSVGECVELATGSALDCRELAQPRLLARESLELSDLVVRGNLLPMLRESRPPAAPARRVAVIGHRGNPEVAPENTLASIAAAFRAGCDLAEVDVRHSRDGVPVIVHDQTVDRTTDGSGNVAELTLDELKALDAGSWKDPRFAGERIPTLAEALEAARGKGRLFLDLPVEGMGDLVAEAFRSAGIPPRDAVVATWSPAQSAEIARHLPGATIVFSADAPATWDDGYFRELRDAGISHVDMAGCTARFVADARRHGLTVWTYTVNDPAVMRELIRMGIDGFETDVPILGIDVAWQMGVHTRGSP